MMHATCRPHAHVGLLVVTAVAVAVALVSAAEVDYTYTCPGTPPVTVQVADLPCDLVPSAFRIPHCLQILAVHDERCDVNV